VGQGTGLGLHVVHKIVLAHQGKIEVDSAVGKGTEFRVRLPFQRSMEGRLAEKAPPSLSVPADRKDAVVVVDDDAPTLKTLQRLLEGEPYTLLATAQPEQALQWVGLRKVGVVVSDQRMPGMAGTQLLESVSKKSPGTACVLLTAYPEDAEVVQSLGASVSTILAKPWDGETLKRTIREHLAIRAGSPESKGNGGHG
jgi:CheY-like chemotaxis protein